MYTVYMYTVYMYTYVYYKAVECVMVMMAVAC